MAASRSVPVSAETAGTKQVNGRIRWLALAEKFFMGAIHILDSDTQPTNVPYKCGTIYGEINRLSSGIKFIANKHCYQIINQTQMSIF